mmetsp:Transcript_59508/g.139304  ORF Transcript_59508/g.139304 Transcript_59508/m.139304 type:complete len:178 (+) Transcript_59508:201-734(+)
MEPSMSITTILFHESKPVRTPVLSGSRPSFWRKNLEDEDHHRSTSLHRCTSAGNTPIGRRKWRCYGKIESYSAFQIKLDRCPDLSVKLATQSCNHWRLLYKRSVCRSCHHCLHAFEWCGETSGCPALSYMNVGVSGVACDVFQHFVANSGIDSLFQPCVAGPPNLKVCVKKADLRPC